MSVFVVEFDLRFALTVNTSPCNDGATIRKITKIGRHAWILSCRCIFIRLTFTKSYKTSIITPIFKEGQITRN